MLAEELNQAGLDMRKTLRRDIEIPWNAATVKEFLWRPVQKTVTGKDSSTRITKTETNAVWEILNRHLGDKFGIHVPFPSKDDTT